MNPVFRTATISIFLSISSFGGDNSWSRAEDWPQLPKGWKLSKVSGVAADSRGRVYVGHRDTHPILYFDVSGKFLGTLGEKEIPPSVYYDLRTDPPTAMERRPWVHGLHVDPWDNLWVTDVGRHVVMKFDPEGKLLLTLGTRDKRDESPTTFNQPTHAVVGGSGHIYVADGYGNSRVVKNSPLREIICSPGARRAAGRASCIRLTPSPWTRARTSTLPTEATIESRSSTQKVGSSRDGQDSTPSTGCSSLKRVSCSRVRDWTTAYSKWT